MGREEPFRPNRQRECRKQDLISSIDANTSRGVQVCADPFDVLALETDTN